jgi:hypothetical protein
MDSAAEKEVIRTAYPYLDFFIVHFKGYQLDISTFWFQHFAGGTTIPTF